MVWEGAGEGQGLDDTGAWQGFWEGGGALGRLALGGDQSRGTLGSPCLATGSSLRPPGLGGPVSLSTRRH